MKVLLNSVAIAAVLVSGVAMAQIAPPADPAPAPAPAEPAPPAITPVPITPAPITPAPGIGGADIAAADARAVGGYVSEQLETDWLATDLLGKEVRTAADEPFGTINDLLLDEGGVFQAAIIGSGGFLGMGQKNVAVAFEDLTVTRDADGNITITTDLTLASLETAPDFTWLSDQPIAEGPAAMDPMAAPGGAPAPAPAPMAPAPAPAPAP